jgi:hypothetical protein
VRAAWLKIAVPASLACSIAQASSDKIDSKVKAARASVPNLLKFEFYRARYFSDLVNSENCLKFDAKSTKALQRRYNRSFKELSKRYPAAKYELSAKTISVEAGSGNGCAGGGPLLGFEDKVVRLENVLATNKK